MAITQKVLIPAKVAENANTAQYTAVNATAVIDKFTATNTSGTTATLSVNLITALGTAGNENLIVNARAIAPGETYGFPELIGQSLDSGGFISTRASRAVALTIRCSGREIR